MYSLHTNLITVPWSGWTKGLLKTTKIISPFTFKTDFIAIFSTAITFKLSQLVTRPVTKRLLGIKRRNAKIPRFQSIFLGRFLFDFFFFFHQKQFRSSERFSCSLSVSPLCSFPAFLLLSHPLVHLLFPHPTLTALPAGLSSQLYRVSEGFWYFLSDAQCIPGFTDKVRSRTAIL